MSDQISQDQGYGGTQVGQADPAAVQTVPLPPPSAAVAMPVQAQPGDAVLDARLTPPGLPPTVPVHPTGGQAADGTDDGYDGQPVIAEIPLPDEAADQDIIEREWIDKVKHVIEKTAHDPFQQVQVLNQLRADYMKKRYDKDVILPDR